MTITAIELRELVDAFIKLGRPATTPRELPPEVKELSALLKMSPNWRLEGRLTAEEIAIVEEIIEEWQGTGYPVSTIHSASRAATAAERVVAQEPLVENAPRDYEWTSEQAESGTTAT